MSSKRSQWFYFFYKRFGSPFKEGASLSQQRKSVERQAGFTLMPSNIQVQPTKVGEMYAEWLHHHEKDQGRVILYLHGGGYTMGSCSTHRSLASQTAIAGRCSALLLDYRLAPENPFPAALDDAKSACLWLLDQGVDPGRIVLAGDSAGGGLAVAAALTLRDEGHPPPAAIVCLSPWLDLTMSGKSVAECAAVDPLLNLETSRMHARLYAGDVALDNPLISPIYADLAGLPPILIQVGEHEILRSDSERLAENARQAGVACTLELWEGMWHVWQMMVGLIPESQEAIDRAGIYIQQQLAAAGSGYHPEYQGVSTTYEPGAGLNPHL